MLFGVRLQKLPYVQVLGNLVASESVTAESMRQAIVNQINLNLF